MKATDRFYEAVKVIWEQYYNHPFIKGMGDGSLDISKFRYFMLQDYLYLFEYARVFAFGVTKADDPEIMRVFSKSIDTILNNESIEDINPEIIEKSCNSYKQIMEFNKLIEAARMINVYAFDIINAFMLDQTDE